MTAQVFIDGQVGTTGLQIAERLARRRDIHLIELAEVDRKSPTKRAAALNDADVAILCLPDEAAKEAVGLLTNNKTRVIDASTAHRVDPAWVYGLAEISPLHRARLRAARYVSNPGCYPTGVVLLLAPLIAAGLIPADYPLTVNAVSGYSGGGRKMIEQFENPQAPDHLTTPFRVYGLNLDHKHIPEMQQHSGLLQRPLFVPSVGRFAQGMIVQLPLYRRLLKGDAAQLHNTLARHYEGQRFVKVLPLAAPEKAGVLDGDSLAGRDDCELHVFADKRGEHILLAAVLDNLGKGASGAAVQNLDLMLGLSG